MPLAWRPRVPSLGTRTTPATLLTGLLPTVWVLVLSLVLLGPALAPGYVLTYDMVWVPDLALGPAALGVSSALPRAVPSDAIVAVLDQLVPGMLLQKVVLLGALVLAGCGIQRLVGDSMVAKLVAATAYLWNPFVVERLWIGHWPLLLGYAALPWVIHSVTRLAAGEARWGAVAGWLVLGSLSPNAGLMTGLAAVVAGLAGHRGRDAGSARLRLVGLVAAVNAPWLVSGILHAGSAVTAGVDAFALNSEGPLPAPLAALGLGGIWNAEVVPASRSTALAWVGLAVTLALGAAGARRWSRSASSPQRVTLVVCAVIGLALALAPTLAPGPLDRLVQTIPGAGLLRDSARSLALLAPLVAVLMADGAQALVERVASPARWGLATALVLLPVMAMPDAAWGVGGALRPVSYPPGLLRAADELDRARTELPGDVVVLPFSSYRAPEWNDGRKVLVPLGRLLGSGVVTSDELLLPGRVVPGEDPLGPRVSAALALPTAQARSEALVALGLQYAAVEDGATPILAGQVLASEPEVTLLRLQGRAPESTTSGGWIAAMAAAWAAWLAVLLTALATLAQRRRPGSGSMRSAGGTLHQRS